MKLSLQILHILCFIKLGFASTLPHEHEREHEHEHHHETRYDSRCDVSRAYSILSGLSSGHSFCSSLIYPRGVPTRTRTKTVTVTGPSCATITKSKTETIRYTFPVGIGSPILSQITITEYASTVIIPSGTHRPVNKRAAIAQPANNPAISTPTALSNCDPENCSRACYSLYKPSTTTTTTTKHIPCRVTETEYTTVEIETDPTYYFTVTPPPDTTTVSDILTTTVPAVCAGLPYIPPGDLGVGNTQGYEQYPFFPRDNLRCCAYCYTIKDCVASNYDQYVDVCNLLLHVDGQLPGKNAICPMGMEDFQFGAPDASGDIYPGPCGY